MRKMIIILSLALVVLISGCVGKGVNMSGNFTINDGNVVVQPNAISIDPGAITGSIADFIKNALSIRMENETNTSA